MRPLAQTRQDSLSSRRPVRAPTLPLVRLLDVFAGAGGLSLGLAAAGFDVVAAVERDADAGATFARAHPAADLYGRDLNGLSLRHLRGQVDVVAGGPPCQPWSTGGKRLGAEDPRDGWPGFLRVLAETAPAAFVAENVAGMAATPRSGRYRALLRELEGLGFTVAAQVVDAADLGVPQHRRRLLIVGTRGPAFAFPPPTHGPGRPAPWRTAGAVLGAVPFGSPNPSVVTYARAPQLRPSPYDGLLFNGGGRPVDPTRPARTLLASMGGNKTPWVDSAGVVPPYHRHLLGGGPPRSRTVEGARRISVAGAAALQSFPPELVFVGRPSSQYRQVGNAVPPLLATALGRALVAQLA